MKRSVLVPVFIAGGRPAKGSLAALSEAAARARELGGSVSAVVVGAELPHGLLVGLGRYGAATVFRSVGEPLVPGPWVDAITRSLADDEYGYVVMAGGPLASAIAGGIAARRGGGVVSDVTALTVAHGELLAERPVFRDSQIAVARFTTGLGVIVARPGAFAINGQELPDAVVETVATETVTTETVAAAAPAGGQRSGLAAGGERVRVVDSGSVDDPGRQLGQADVVVTGGRGLGGAEYFAEIEALAEVLGAHMGEGAVGATRAVVDAGWRELHEQIGLTGRTVSPKLYVAVGVSGAPQHRVGMETAEHILAINSDPRAPIFAFSDLGVIADFKTLLPRLNAVLRSRGARPQLSGS